MKRRQETVFGWWAVKITGLCTAVFLLSPLFPDFFYNNFILVSGEIYEKPWTLITHMFMHGNVMHLFSNMIIFIVAGSVLEKEIGSRRFLLVFFMGGFASSLADVLFYHSTLGASGAVYAVVGCLAVLRPKSLVMALGVPVYTIVAAFIWIALDIAGILFPDDVAHWAHIFGLIAGIVYALWIRKEFPQKKRKEKKEDVISEEELEEWEKRYMMKHIT